MITRKKKGGSMEGVDQARQHAMQAEDEESNRLAAPTNSQGDDQADAGAAGPGGVLSSVANVIAMPFFVASQVLDTAKAGKKQHDAKKKYTQEPTAKNLDTLASGVVGGVPHC